MMDLIFEMITRSLEIQIIKN